MLATSSDDLLNFLNSDNDIRPARELMKKRLTPHMANSMEGLLTEEELEFRVHHHLVWMDSLSTI